MQYCETIEGKLYLITMLAHTSGQWMKSVYPIISKDQTSQSIGSAVTYAKRYSLCAMVGIVTDEENKKDDDGESALGRNKYSNGSKATNKIESMPAEQDDKKPITKEQYIKLEGLLKENPELRKNLLGYMQSKYSLDSLDKMPVDLYLKAMERATVKAQGAN